MRKRVLRSASSEEEDAKAAGSLDGRTEGGTDRGGSRSAGRVPRRGRETSCPPATFRPDHAIRVARGMLDPVRLGGMSVLEQRVVVQEVHDATKVSPARERACGCWHFGLCASAP